MEEIIKIVSLQLGTREVHEGSMLVEDLSAESADVANIVAVLEERYQVVFKESEIAKIRMPNDLYELTKSKLDDSHF